MNRNRFASSDLAPQNSRPKPSSSKQPAALSSIQERLATIAHPTPSQSHLTRHQIERRRQVRGLLLLALVISTLSLLRAGVHNLFHAGWWRLW